jgi:hypothetical protein
VIRSTAWQVEHFGSGCAGLRNMPAKVSSLDESSARGQEQNLDLLVGFNHARGVSELRGRQ